MRSVRGQYAVPPGRSNAANGFRENIPARVNGPPSHIGRYEVRKELGRGTMGVVYEAHDPALGRVIALKTIQVPLAASAAEREAYERRFLAEARIAARLSHAGIVVVHDVARDTEHGILYIALEYLHGRTLAEVAGEGPMEWRRALRLVGRVAEALHYAHAQGVVHRDIKPANIMVLDSGEPKIMDFGIAKLEAAQLTSTGQFFGTPLFMSPEQALGQPVDARTDLFSLGSVAYLLLSGRPPFEADSVPGILTRVAYQPPRPLREAAPGVPQEVEYLVMRAMAKDPAARYADGRAMAEDAEDIVAGRPPRHRAGWTAPAVGTGTVAARTPELPELSLETEAPAARPRRRWRTTARLLAALGAVSALYFYLHPADWQFWRRAVVEARRSRVGEELRGWWARLVVEPPGDLPPAVTPPTQPKMPPPTVPALTPPAMAAPDSEPRPTPALASAPPPEDAPAGLDIEFEHHLRRGNLQVWVDDVGMVDEDFDGRVARKVLALELRKGVVQQKLTVAPGPHEVRVQVRWDDNVKSARISGRFRPGASRRLAVQVGRLRGNLSLAWK